jgi:riboflavin synthase
MFTGLIEEIGYVQSVRSLGDGKEISISANKILTDIHKGDSISVNGVCQTVTAFTNTVFTVQAIEETLTKTTFSSLTKGTPVNLERALLPTTRLGGHIVQGHVDGVGEIQSITPLTTSWEIWVSFPAKFSPYVIPIGSICINGISLTVAKTNQNSLMVAIIPETWNNTVIQFLKVGEKVNLEFDIIAKYIENMTKGYTNPADTLTLQKLKDAGW